MYQRLHTVSPIPPANVIPPLQLNFVVYHFSSVYQAQRGKEGERDDRHEKKEGETWQTREKGNKGKRKLGYH